jgi:hypothetical protein
MRKQHPQRMRKQHPQRHLRRSRKLRPLNRRPHQPRNPHRDRTRRRQPRNPHRDRTRRHQPRNRRPASIRRRSTPTRHLVVIRQAHIHQERIRRLGLILARIHRVLIRRPGTRYPTTLAPSVALSALHAEHNVRAAAAA